MSNTTEETLFGSIEPIEIQEEMERSFLDYAMSVIVARALPDARDGLKPVHRRILYGMHDMGARTDRPHMKCARITGDVMGKYHPHGDSAIYDALVRMAQNFSLRHPVIDGHGNFGSPDDPPAAARYTECRLAPIANALLDGIDEDTVDFADNYSGEFTEPVVLPARFPNLLVNGSQGIAVGMATNIPPHNLGEVIDAVTHLIDNPTATPEDLMKFVKGPDFPTGGFILGSQGIKDAYTTGRGSIKMRAKAEIEEGKKGQIIVVTQIPYQTSVGGIATRIAELVNNRELEGIRNVNDESAKGLTRLVVELKRDANANVILNNLYKHTAMQTSFGVNMVALVDGVPRTLNLAQSLTAYVDHQIVVITRRSQFRLDKAKARAHIVEGLVKALSMIDAIVEAIKKSADREEARLKLMKKPFDFSEIQANHILDMTLSRLTRLGQKQLDDELAELMKTITDLESILNDDKKLRKVIKSEMAEIRDKFYEDRVCKIVRDEGDIDVLDLIEDEQLVITMTRSGYIKSTPLDAFRTQGRGGRGVQGAKLKEEDIVSEVIYATSHAFLLFFSNKGKIYRIKAHEIPQKDRTARGMAIVNLLSLVPGESIQAVIDTREFSDDRYLFFGTKLGQVKKTTFSEYDKSRRDGFIAINLKDNDELVRVVVTNGNDSVMMITKMGQGIRFNENDVRPMGRDTAGVRGMKLKPGDQVVSLDVARDDEHVLMVTTNGYGKRTLVEKFNGQGRGGQGVRAIKISDKKGQVVAAFMVAPEDELFAMNSGGVAIRLPAKDISEQGRDATGVRVMSLEKDQEVVTAAPIYAMGPED